MFEKASRLKLKFPTTVGQIRTEDLWDLPLTSQRGASLDGVAITVHEELEKLGKKSFVNKNKGDAVLELKMSIVKHIIEVKQSEASEANKLAENKAERNIILDVIAEKQMDTLKETSMKDLLKKAKKLEGK